MKDKLNKVALQSVINSIKYFVKEKEKTERKCKNCVYKKHIDICKECYVDKKSNLMSWTIYNELENYYDLTIDFVTDIKNKKFHE